MISILVGDALQNSSIVKIKHHLMLCIRVIVSYEFVSILLWIDDNLDLEISS